MNVAIYARVSSEVQEQRGTIGSQVEVLRARMAAEGHEIVAEFLDDGYSGARLDRPGLDALRDAAEAGVIEAVWCRHPIASRAPTRIRCSCSTNSTGLAARCGSPTRPRSTTIPRRGC